MEITVVVSETVEADVAVVGGGTAGCYAAVAAAEAGANTVLVEKNGILGGTVVMAGVDFPGLFFAWGRQVISGLGWKAVKRAEELGGAEIPVVSYCPTPHWRGQVRLNQYVYATVLDEMLSEAGADVRLHTMLAAAKEKNGCVEILTAGKHGLALIRARTAIDATGDADLARMLGYPCYKSKQLQPATLQNKISGYDLDSINMQQTLSHVRQALQNAPLGELVTAEKLCAYLQKGQIDQHITCPLDADTSTGKARLEIEARKTQSQIVQLLRQVPGLQDLTLDYTAPECGVRETNRIVGEYTVTREDYLSGVVFDDAVCYAFYPIDLHVPMGVEKTFLSEGVVPTIPYRALIPKGSVRLLAAGRILSSDTEANSALRVEAPCMAMGQAAGCAAAIAVKEECAVGNVDYASLCHMLVKQGAIVPSGKRKC